MLRGPDQLFLLQRRMMMKKKKKEKKATVELVVNMWPPTPTPARFFQLL